MPLLKAKPTSSNSSSGACGMADFSVDGIA